MVNAAIHSPFASHVQSRRAPAAASSHRDAQPVAVVAAAAQVGATPPLSRWWFGRLRSAASARPVAPPGFQRARGNDNTAPRPDASVAKKTSAEVPLRRARRPRPTARTDAVFRHNSAGHKIAAGFETRQTARSWLIPQPLFWHHLGTCFRAYHTQKRACPHCQGHVAIPASKRAHLINSGRNLLNSTIGQRAFIEYISHKWREQTV
jgi:hypothetical protein